MKSWSTRLWRAEARIAARHPWIFSVRLSEDASRITSISSFTREESTLILFASKCHPVTRPIRTAFKASKSTFIFLTRSPIIICLFSSG